MPVFFFDFFDGEKWAPAQDGIELESAEQAYAEAFAGARDMLNELADGKANPFACAFEIRAADGQSLFRFTFDELLGKSPIPRPDPGSTGSLVVTLEKTHDRAMLAKAELSSSIEHALGALQETKGMVGRLEAFGRPRI